MSRPTGSPTGPVRNENYGSIVNDVWPVKWSNIWSNHLTWSHYAWVIIDPGHQVDWSTKASTRWSLDVQSIMSWLWLFQIKASTRVINPKEAKFMTTEPKFHRQLFSRNLARARAILNWVFETTKILRYEKFKCGINAIMNISIINQTNQNFVN